MKKWYICEDPQGHQNPWNYRVIGVAYQEQQGDPKGSGSFLLLDGFSAWLVKKKLCAFSDGYEKALRVSKNMNYPILYCEGRTK